jgi:hypothetical protein
VDARTEEEEEAEEGIKTRHPTSEYYSESIYCTEKRLRVAVVLKYTKIR